MKNLIYTLLLLVLSCSHLNNNSRDIAQADDKNNMNSDPAESIINKIDKLFILLIKANDSIREFNSDIDQMLAQKKKEDSDLKKHKSTSKTDFNPLNTESYKRLLKIWNLKESYEHEIEEIYEEALKVQFSLAVQTEADSLIRKNSKTVLKAINQYLIGLKKLQQIELQSFMKILNDKYKKTIREYKAQVQKKPQLAVQDIAQISEVTLFDFKIISNGKKLTQLSIESQSIEERKNSNVDEKLSKFSDAIENELIQLAEPVIDSSNERTPNAIPGQILSCDGKKKICISTGEEGNIVGKIFPAGVWAITYDDGPAPVTSNQIMNMFLKYKDKVNPRGQATFFWTAANALANESILGQAIKNDFPVENHSYNHKDLLKQDQEGRNFQIIKSNQVLEMISRKFQSDYKVRYFRCPYGSCYAPKIPEVRQMLVDQRQIHVYWRIDSLDWKLLNGPQIADLVIKQIQLQDRGVILMHDVHSTTVDASALILKWLKKQNDSGATNYKLVTIRQAVDMVNGK